ncbi:MAG: YedE-related selenium metabolism membrane protein [Anaerolineae bacterium]|nr:YedE-related selenium metabolism membrane protein [Anaerolineae bacterium]
MFERLTRFFASRGGLILAGSIIGVLASLLQYAGNPPNMGICVAGFERDIVGALGFHRAAAVQYIRPEIIGFVLGATLAALLFGEFKSRATSASMVYFVLGVCPMIGALVFQGCPLRGLLRLAGADLNAVVGLAGFAVGVVLGVQFLKSGYTPGYSSKMSPVVGWILPVMMIGLFALRLFRPQFSDGGPIFFSVVGAGSMHAALWVSLGAGLLIGFLGQRTRFCIMGAVRDVALMRETSLLSGVGGVVVAAFVTNLLLGQVNFGFADQPVAQSLHGWNFLGMVLVGLASALAGGCPSRQLFLAGEGSGDASMFVVGMFAGAVMAHNLNMVKPCVTGSMPVTISLAGMMAVLVGLVACLIIGFSMRERENLS